MKNMAKNSRTAALTKRYHKISRKLDRFLPSGPRGMFEGSDVKLLFFAFHNGAHSGRSYSDVLYFTKKRIGAI